ncbi:hypothetical protein J6590_101355 [Homalodisca vitripennis]|nr:hypothetical protein J6590_101355 [Homalodisca vitripennis]
MQVASTKFYNTASISVSVEDDYNLFGGFHSYNLKSGISELVPAYDTLDEKQAQSLRAPEVELQNKEGDDIIDNSRYVLPYSHGPARRRHNRVNVIRAIEEPGSDYELMITLVIVMILLGCIFIWILTLTFNVRPYQVHQSKNA